MCRRRAREPEQRDQAGVQREEERQAKADAKEAGVQREDGHQTEADAASEQRETRAWRRPSQRTSSEKTSARQRTTSNLERYAWQRQPRPHRGQPEQPPPHADAHGREEGPARSSSEEGPETRRQGQRSP